MKCGQDLRDFVGHHITGMVVFAQGASRIVERSPQQARRALEHIEEIIGSAHRVTMESLPDIRKHALEATKVDARSRRHRTGSPS